MSSDQTKVEKNETESVCENKRRSGKTVQCKILDRNQYPQWVANVVLVPKKDGKVRMCVHYRDMNRASPKDDFPLPHIDTLVDNTTTSSHS